MIIVNCRVDKYIFKYEPLYVARAETPQFDERFIGFGMTRNTQVQFWLNKALQSVQPWELKSNVWRKTIVVTEFKSCSMFRSIKDYSFLFVLYSLKVVNYMPDACAWLFSFSINSVLVHLYYFNAARCRDVSNWLFVSFGHLDTCYTCLYFSILSISIHQKPPGVRDVRGRLQVPPPQQRIYITLGIPGTTR